MAAPADLRPRTVGEILDASFVLYRRAFGPLLLAATVFSVPTLLVALVLAEPAGAAFSGLAGSYRDYFGALQQSHGQWTRAVQDSYFDTIRKAMDLNVFFYASSLAQSVSRGGACVAAAFLAEAAIRREPFPGGRAMVRAALPRTVAASLVWFTASVVNTMCSICVPVPIVVSAVLAPACAVIALERGENERAVAAWSAAPLRWFCAPFAVALDATVRCLRLSMHGMTIVRGSTVFAILLLFVSVVVGVVAGAAALAWSSFEAGFVANHWGEVLFLPVLGIASALWYADLRVRREGADFGDAA